LFVLCFTNQVAFKLDSLIHKPWVTNWQQAFEHPLDLRIEGLEQMGSKECFGRVFFAAKEEDREALPGYVEMKRREILAALRVHAKSRLNI
jgi:hypothetical protein